MKNIKVKMPDSIIAHLKMLAEQKIPMSALEIKIPGENAPAAVVAFAIGDQAKDLMVAMETIGKLRDAKKIIAGDLPMKEFVKAVETHQNN